MAILKDYKASETLSERRYLSLTVVELSKKLLKTRSGRLRDIPRFVANLAAD